jgi:ABC-type uncharacterized transport system ATPase subunit
VSLKPALSAGAISVETIGMTMRFEGFTALDDVSIAIARGSFHALLGENGAGKSTLVKCMMGFYQATAGEMLVAGREAIVPEPKAAPCAGPRDGLSALHSGAVFDGGRKPCDQPR